MELFGEDNEIMNMIRNDMNELSEREKAVDIQSASPVLVSMLVRIQMPIDTLNCGIRTFFDGIGAEMTKRAGFRSRKVIDSPSTNSHRIFLILIKFSGWQDLCDWEESEELQYWISFGKSLNFEFQRTMVKSPVLRVNLSVLAEGYSDEVSQTMSVDAPSSLAATGSPPKWKMWLLIWFFVFLCVTTSAYVGTFEKVDEEIGGDYAFSLLISLFTVVPLMAYCLLPIALSIPQVRHWLTQRPYSPTTSNMFIRLLDKGLTIFRQPSPATIPLELTNKILELESRVESMKLKIIQLQHSSLPSMSSQSFDSTSSSMEEGVSLRHSVQLMNTAGDGGGDGGAPRSTQSSQLMLNNDQQQVDVDKSTGEVTVTVKHNIKWEFSHEFELWNLKMERAMHLFSETFHGVDVFNRSYVLGIPSSFKPFEREVVDAWNHNSTQAEIKIDDTESSKRVERIILDHDEQSKLNQTSQKRKTLFDSEYVVIFRYADRMSMERWLSSNIRASLLQEAHYMFQGESRYKHVHNQVPLGEGGESGSLVNAGDIFGELLVGDFSDSSSPNPSRQHQPPSPPLYRSTILTLLGLFIVAWPVNYRLGKVLIDGGVRSPPLIVLCLTCITVFGNVYVTAPLVFFFFATWLQCPPPVGHQHGYVLKTLSVGFPNNKVRVVISVLWFAAHWISVYV